MNVKAKPATHVGRLSPNRSIGRKIIRATLALFAVLILAGLTGWSVLAIYYGNSHTSTTQTVLAAVFGLVGIAAVGGLFIQRWRRHTLGAFSLLFVVVLIWWFNIPPSNDRQWQEDVAQLAHATIEGDLVTVHNVRNITYRSETDFTPTYYTKTYDLSKLDSVDLYAVYWMGPAIAHTVVSFGFGGEDYLAVSIEARKEQGESYSTFKGFFRQYEQIHIVSDERDVIRLRTNFRKDPPEHVYRYRLQFSPELARKFFLDYVKTINEENVHPRFYNTLTANCTNVIWTHAHVNPDRIPFSWKVLASGYAPEYLYEQGRLDTSVSFAELKQQGYVNPIAHALGDTADFSRQIRAGQSPLDTQVSQ